MQNETGALTKEVAALFRARMAQAQVKQSEIADAVGVSQSQLSKILRGQRQMTIDVYFNLCAVLGLDPSRVMNQAWQTVSTSADLVFPVSWVDSKGCRLVGQA